MLDCMTIHASGTFEVTLTPQPVSQPPAPAEGANVGRLVIAKAFAGDLQATSAGQMLAFRGEVEGSAGYVALEQVSGTLHGLTDSFALQHSGTMNRGMSQLHVMVVPDSGTGQLMGLAGEMQLDQSGGGHAYTLVYTLPKTE